MALSSRYKQIVHTFSDQGVRSVTTLVTGVLIAKWCTVSEHGLFVVGFLSLILAANFQEALVGTPLYVLFPSRRKGFAAKYQQCLAIWQLVIALLSVLILLLVAAVALVSGKAMGWTILLISPLAGMVMIRDFVRQTYFAGLRPIRALFFDGLVAILQISLLVLLLVEKRLSAITALYAIGVSSFCVAVVPFARRLCTDRIHSFRYCVSVGKVHLRFGRWRLGSYGMIWLVLQSYPLLLAFFCDVQQTSRYGACQRVAMICSPFMAGMINIFLPYLSSIRSRRGEHGVWRPVVLLSFITAIILGVWALVLTFRGEWLLGVLYKQEYAKDGLLLNILIIAVLVHGLSFCVGLGIVAQKKLWLDMVVYGLAGVVTLPSGIWLAHSYGAVGAALGYLSCVSCVTILRWAYFLLCYRVDTKLAILNEGA